jgi:GNAT superfamily N-acetyltransferase
MTVQLKLPFIEQQYHVSELRDEQQDLDIIRMAEEFAEEINLNEYIDPVIVKVSCTRVRNDMKRKDLNCWLAYLNDEAIGFLVAICFPTWYNRKIVSEQKIWFVSKQYRGTRAAFLLIKAYEQWARLNGATQMYTGVANHDNSERHGKILEKLGFRRVGSTHVKEV